MSIDWEKLKTDNISAADALTEFTKLVGSGWLEARYPNSVGVPRLRVRIQPAHFVDHCLYKNEDDGRSRADVFTRDPNHYMQERADRINWLGPCLIDPDSIYQRVENPQEMFYVRHAIDQETVVAILSRISNGASELKTFYVVFGKKKGEGKAFRAKLTSLDMRYCRKN